LPIRIEAFGEFSVFQQDRLAHIIYFLISGFTPSPGSYLVKITMNAAKHFAGRVDAFLRRFAHEDLVWLSSTLQQEAAVAFQASV